MSIGSINWPCLRLVWVCALSVINLGSAQAAEYFESDAVLTAAGDPSCGTCQSLASGGVGPLLDTTPADGHLAKRRPGGAAEPGPGGAPSTLDVMILYTTAARERFGEAEVHAKIALSIAYLNEAFKRSGVHARARLVYQGEATWHQEREEAIDELSWLICDSTVTALSNDVGADLVSLFARHAKPTGGMGLLPGAFSVFNGSPFLFAQEIGHNLGCAHDRAHADTIGRSDGFNYGYSFTPPGSCIIYGDLMSYVGSQIEQFSNPDCYFMGAPTGRPAGHRGPDGRPDAADNRAVINQSAPLRAQSAPTRAPRLVSGRFSPDGTQFVLQISGPDELACTFEHSQDQVTWTRLGGGTLSSGRLEMVDSAPVERCRFYRARFDGDWLPVHAGYVKKIVPPGYSMLANPLESLGNAIASLLPDAPEGVQVYKWIEGRQRWECNTFALGAWDNPAMTLHPGEGAVVDNRTGAPWTITFVGEPNQTFHNRIPLQHSIRSSAIPEAGPLSSLLGCRPFGPGAQIFRMNSPTGSYTAYTWDGQCWSPHEPVFEIGEAFWCRNPLNAFVWERRLGCW